MLSSKDAWAVYQCTGAQTATTVERLEDQLAAVVARSRKITYPVLDRGGEDVDLVVCAVVGLEQLLVLGVPRLRAL